MNSETEKEKKIRILKDAIIKINSVMENLNCLKAGGAEEKRKHIRMALTLEQAEAGEKTVWENRFICKGKEVVHS